MDPFDMSRCHPAVLLACGRQCCHQPLMVSFCSIFCTAIKLKLTQLLSSAACCFNARPLQRCCQSAHTCAGNNQPKTWSSGFSGH